ncbi:unknown [Prevotella sp. CAG:1124]|nr:unknown [Prevotella sp. CAG:1124]
MAFYSLKGHLLQCNLPSFVFPSFIALFFVRHFLPFYCFTFLLLTVAFYSLKGHLLQRHLPCFTFLLFYLFTFNHLFSPSHFFTFSPLNLFLFNVLYGIFARRNPALYCHCGETYQQNDGARHDNPRPPRDAIAVLRNPVGHEMHDNRHGNDERYADIQQECAYQTPPHSTT